MDAVVMCGGQGSRLDAPVEKPLFEIAGRPMIERVYTALARSRLDTVYAVPSTQTPETRAFLRDRSIPCIETPGEGYVADLQATLEVISGPLVTVVADLPLISGRLIDQILAAYDTGALTVCVPAVLKERLGVSYDRSFDHRGRRLVPAGLNIVAGSRNQDTNETTRCTYNARLAVNVNRIGDARAATALLDTPAESSSQTWEGA